MLNKSVSSTMLSVMEIERFAIHDGPGIRSVIFLQGCPLHCPWCSNPESQSAAPALMHQNKDCIFCGTCAALCPQKAITVMERSFQVDHRLCINCQACQNHCPTKAIRFSSNAMSVEDILAVVKRDEPYYKESGGGITISGGEVFFQFSGLLTLVRTLRNCGYSICLETCGQAPRFQFQAILPYIDYFLYDIKHINADKLRRITGGNLSQIMENLRFLCQDTPNKVILRTPVIPGFNYDKETLHCIADLAKSLSIPEIHYLPFHPLGKSKYEQLGLPYAYGSMKMLAESELQPYAEYAKKQGLAAFIGG